MLRLGIRYHYKGNVLDVERWCCYRLELLGVNEAGGIEVEGSEKVRLDRQK